MKTLLSLSLSVGLMIAVAGADAQMNANGLWALHNAGPHNSKSNTCSYLPINCREINTDGGDAGERNDIYIIAVDVMEVSATRYGLHCATPLYGPLYFYGWTSCSELDVPTAGWPGCGEGNAQTWSTTQPGPYVTLGILDVYVYSASKCIVPCADPRIGVAVFCDRSEPSPSCFSTNEAQHFVHMEFNSSGCSQSACRGDRVVTDSWGVVKSLYR
jgi:hypothetical protein